MRIAFVIMSIMTIMFAQNNEIKLPAPDLDRGLPVMQALSLRASATEFDTTDLNPQDISDLLWAANGINRPDSGKRTAPSAMNSQDIDVYVFTKEAVYLYEPQEHKLVFVAEGDNRLLVAGRQEAHAKAPVILLLVSDISKFKLGEDSLKMIWAAEDAGIVSQNIAIFCAGVGLSTRPRASMDIEAICELLKLSESQHPMLNNPVSN